MKKRTISFLLALIVLCGCQEQAKKEQPKTFHEMAVSAVSEQTENSIYQEGNWWIGISSVSLPDKEEQIPTITIRQSVQNDKEETIVSMTMEKHPIPFFTYEYKEIYKQEEKKQERVLTLSSTGEAARTYHVRYTEYEYRNNVYHDQHTYEGTINVDTSGTVSGDPFPLLKTGMEKTNAMLEAFCEKFHVSYQEDSSFVNLPALILGSELAIDAAPQEETAAKKLYVSDERINARGFSILTFLQIEKDASTASFGEYNLQRKDYETKAKVKLKKQGEHTFDMIPLYDGTSPYHGYQSDDTLYLYSEAVSYEEIEQDILQQNGAHAGYILKKSYPPLF